MNNYLLNDRLLLREFIVDDWIDVHKYASNELACKYQPWGPNTEEDSKNFVKQAMIDAKKNPRSRYVFAIQLKADHQMVGAGEINIRDMTNKEGEIAYIVIPDFWGMGIATEAASLLIDFGFETLNLHRIYATCDPRNIASSRVLEKNGMTMEGIIRENVFIKDGWRDSLLYSILEYER